MKLDLRDLRFHETRGADRRRTIRREDDRAVHYAGEALKAAACGWADSSRANRRLAADHLWEAVGIYRAALAAKAKNDERRTA